MTVRPTRVRRLRIRRAIRVSTVALTIGTATLTYFALEKNVMLVVDGRPEAVSTMSGNVADLLASEGVTLSAGYEVRPPLATSLADGMVVVVSADRQVLPAPQGVGVWVMEKAGGSFARPAIQSAERWVPPGGTVGSSRVMAARVVVRGKEHDVLTNAATVRELLSAMGITPDRNDRVSPSPSTPLQALTLVTFRDVRIRVRHVRAPIPYTVSTTYTNDLAPGRTRVVREGEPGAMLLTYGVRLVDGVRTHRVLLSREVLRPAVPERRLVGARPTTHAGAEVGEASWYSFAPGSGYTAAHPWLPFGTVVTVTNLDNGKKVKVVINDRGPFGGRIIDLSEEAFSAIASLSQGVAHVRLTW